MKNPAVLAHSRSITTGSAETMCVMPGRASVSKSLPARNRALRQLQRVPVVDVVVRGAVDEQQRALQVLRQRDQARLVVGRLRFRQQAQVALGVVRVVVFPVGDRGAGDRGLEHVRPTQHAVRRHVAAERPADDADAVAVHLRERACTVLAALSPDRRAARCRTSGRWPFPIRGRGPACRDRRSATTMNP